MMRLIAALAFGALILLVTPTVLRAVGAPAPIDPEAHITLLGGPLPASPFILKAKDPIERSRAIQCLAEAVYYEAGVESEAGRRAVAQVVINRVRDRNFPASICGVVYQGADTGGVCQFSFACDGSLDRRAPDDRDWEMAWRIAEDALSGRVVDEVGAATHYHAGYVRPYWRQTLVEVAQIGAHQFYRWPGRAGLASALKDRYQGGETPLAYSLD